MGCNNAGSWYARMIAAYEQEMIDEELALDEEYMSNSDFAEDIDYGGYGSADEFWENL